MGVHNIYTKKATPSVKCYLLRSEKNVIIAQYSVDNSTDFRAVIQNISTGVLQIAFTTIEIYGMPYIIPDNILDFSLPTAFILRLFCKSTKITVIISFSTSTRFSLSSLGLVGSSLFIIESLKSEIT